MKTNKNRFAKTCSVFAVGIAALYIGELPAATVKLPAVTLKAKGISFATPACGFSCSNLYSLSGGLSMIQYAEVPGDDGSGGMVGQRIQLNTASNSSPNEDFTMAEIDTISDLCPGTLSTYICNTYPGTTPVYEWNWAPFGNNSGLCTGVSSTPTPGKSVTLQDCGITASTLWFSDVAHAVTQGGQTYAPLVNGGSVNSSFLLTVDADNNQLNVQSLNINTCGTVPDTQQFTFFTGPVT